MDKAKDVLAVLGAGIAIGVIITVVLITALGVRPKEIYVPGASFEIPTTAVLHSPTPMPQPTYTLAQPTLPTRLALQSPTPMPRPTSDLWQFYVDDIKSTVPNAQVTVDTLKEIARKIPSSVAFFAEAEVGLIPYQHTWRILDREGPAFLNAPEGGYAYIAWGYGTITTDRFSISFPAVEDNGHLVLVVGNPDDGTFKDLNTPLRLTNYHPGFAGTNFAAPAKGQIFANRNVINKAWFAQQLWWASKHRSITVTIWDISNGDQFVYDVNPSNFVWTRK